MTEKLKPCPFCGGEVELSTPWFVGDSRYIECMIDCCCEVRGSAEYPRGFREREEAILEKKKVSNEARRYATELWNTRADMHTELESAIDYLKEEIDCYKSSEAELVEENKKLKHHLEALLEAQDKMYELEKSGFGACNEWLVKQSDSEYAEARLREILNKATKEG